ncbi:S8 family peptidase [Bifidobacterium coryneforme]|uniref:S8 family peptidase n=1 Tax=Bifidobacterium coryneforme TaxID=1687 RepID=UPI00130DD156|nr:S8 family peptidase [Bifidobacterium coryneforme]
MAQFILHPKYIAKSYQPTDLFDSFSMRLLGSRPCRIVTQDRPDESHISTSLLIAGKRHSFVDLLTDLQKKATVDKSEALASVIRIEEIRSFDAVDKIHTAVGNDDWYELVLHKFDRTYAPNNTQGLHTLAGELEVEIKDKLIFEANNLVFYPVHGAKKGVEQLAKYSTIRAIRPMPKLRMEPMGDTLRSFPTSVQLPLFQKSNNRGPAIIVLDGGLPDDCPINDWVERYSLSNPDADNVDDFASHGLAVCSALLFGNIRGVPEPLHTQISVARVIDSSCKEDDPLSLYKALANIKSELETGAYDFANLSLGPELPIEDDDVSAWTAVLDSLLVTGECLVTVAVGNNGERDQNSGNARIMIPSDCVNAMSVGAATSEEDEWDRAPYSAIGPGRSPGIVKPDVVAFGGVKGHEFHVLTPGRSPHVGSIMGTSFAAPLALRKAVQVYEAGEGSLLPLTTKALLIHTAEPHETKDKDETGWGRISSNVENIVTTNNGEATIVYQGHLNPGKYLRARIPIPQQVSQISEKVEISATFAFSCPVDPQSPDVYTRAGLTPTFRPKTSLTGTGTHPSSQAFFTSRDTSTLYPTEEQQRKDQGKWETVRHSSIRKLGTSLSNPVFDVHYISRKSGGVAKNAEPIPYSLIITLKAPKISNLSELILNEYQQLIELKPTIDVSDIEN